MSSQSFPSVVVLSLDALMTGKQLAWEDYMKVGPCYLPQAVFEEINNLKDRAPDREQEEVARKFSRFWAVSGWYLTAAYAELPTSFDLTAEQHSKQLRINIETLRSACGLAEEMPNNLIVLVSNSQPFLNEIKSVGLPNLCGVTAAMLLQWARMRERPVAATKQLQVMLQSRNKRASGNTDLTASQSKTKLQDQTKIQSSGSSAQPNMKPSDKKKDNAGKKKVTPSAGSKSVNKSSQKNVRKSASQIQKENDELEASSLKRQADFTRKMYKQEIYKNNTHWITHIFNAILALIFIAIAIGIPWSFFFPASFNQFVNKNVMPILPKEIRQKINK